MKEPWLERFRVWLCSKIGHAKPLDIPWTYAGRQHSTCSRCRRIQSKPV